MQDNEFDVIIIGAGLGGLLCGVILAKEGKRVCILEKNRQIGGCLQTFAFQKKVFDSCVHYVGGLAEGSSLHKIFSYAGILDKLSLKSLDEHGFDQIAFGEELDAYPLANREHFVESLLPFFPKEKEALEAYLDKIFEVVSHFPLYNLRAGAAAEKEAVTQLDLLSVLRGLTPNERLVKVLAGNNFLYAGCEDKTPFYSHALSMDGYLHSAHKVLPGSSQISKFLWKELLVHGGEIHRNTEVTQLEEIDGKILWAMSGDGQKWYAKSFISAVHPSVLLSITKSKTFRPAFRERVKTMPHTPSAIMLNLVLKPATVAYLRQNIYWHPSGEVFGKPLNDGHYWPDTQAFFFNEDAQNPGFAESVSILVYAALNSFLEWEETSNITGIHAKRNEAYESKKEAMMNAILSKTFTRYPELKTAIVARSMASPLSFRDYTGTPNGSMYGPLKDLRFPAQTQIGLRTKISNLFLTGQNVNLHGVMGVSITAVATCAELIGMNYLLDKINQKS